MLLWTPNAVVQKLRCQNLECKTQLFSIHSNADYMKVWLGGEKSMLTFPEFHLLEIADTWKHRFSGRRTDSGEARPIGACWCLHCIVARSGGFSPIWFDMEVVAVSEEWQRPSWSCNLWGSSWSCCCLSCTCWWGSLCIGRSYILVQ
jgi:hypothetical protein